MKTASIIISSYNYAAFLPQAIDSALAQSYPRVEVIVVDDGSTDESQQIIRSYGSRVRSIFKENAGQASSLNAGFAHSSGGVVIFLDSDDALEPDAVERAVVLMTDLTSKVHWPLRKMDASGRRRQQLEPCSELPRGDLRAVVLGHGPRSDDYLWPPTSGNAWSRAFLQRVMPIPLESYRTCPDLYLCALAPLYGRIESVPRPLGLWRDHGENNTWKEPFLPRLTRYAQLWDRCCADLERHARQLDLGSQPDQWKRESWWHRLQRAAHELCRIIPRGQTILLIDDDQWACHELDGRPVLPLLAAGGAPADDAQAVRELDARIASGARWLVIGWSSFWWLEHYAPFARHLRTSFRCVADTDDIVVFDLSPNHRNSSHG